MASKESDKIIEAMAAAGSRPSVIVKAIEQTYPPTSLAHQLAMRQDVYRKVRKYKNFGTVANLQSIGIGRPGRPRLLPKAAEEFIAGLIEANPGIWQDEIQVELDASEFGHVSTSTISRTIKRSGFKTNAKRKRPGQSDQAEGGPDTKQEMDDPSAQQGEHSPKHARVDAGPESSTQARAQPRKRAPAKSRQQDQDNIAPELRDQGQDPATVAEASPARAKRRYIKKKAPQSVLDTVPAYSPQAPIQNQMQGQALATAPQPPAIDASSPPPPVVKRKPGRPRKEQTVSTNGGQDPDATVQTGTASVAPPAKRRYTKKSQPTDIDNAGLIQHQDLAAGVAGPDPSDGSQAQQPAKRKYVRKPRQDQSTPVIDPQLPDRPQDQTQADAQLQVEASLAADAADAAKPKRKYTKKAQPEPATDLPASNPSAQLQAEAQLEVQHEAEQGFPSISQAGSEAAHTLSGIAQSLTQAVQSGIEAVRERTLSPSKGSPGKRKGAKATKA